MCRLAPTDSFHEPFPVVRRSQGIPRTSISTVARQTIAGETGKPSMALSNSERQRKYRERRLGVGGKHERISCLVSIATKRSLERLALHFDRTITSTIEMLITERTSEVLGQLDEDGQQRFLSQGFVSEDA